MYLKSLVLKGFKSFADRSALALEPGITAIVGPNGSGKSNISDAVLWVLGERSARNLRGQAMEDIIFAGSAARKAVSIAEVDLVLDNSDHTLPVEFDEVVITRRMYRTGESEYLVNGVVSRRLDVLDILHDTGLGTGTHSIISQGSLDSILQSRPEDRRALIEEAAGVLKHKQRKEKSARKLAAMDNHLARVRDVAAEVERQLGPLERKAKRAEAYKKASGELSELRLALAVDDLRSLQAEWDKVLAAEKDVSAEVDAKRATVDAAEQKVNDAQEAMKRESEDAGELARRQRRASNLNERLDGADMLLRERKRAAVESESSLNSALGGSAARRRAAERELADAQAQLRDIEGEWGAAQAKAESLQAQRDEAQQRYRSAEDAIADLAGQVRACDAELEAAKREQDRLQEALSSGLAQVKIVEARKVELDGDLQRAQEDHEKAMRALDEVKAQLEDIKTREAKAQEALIARFEERDEAHAARDAAHKQLHLAEVEIEAIEQAQAASREEDPALQWLVENAERFESSLTPLSKSFKVEPSLEQLVESLLGDDLAALAVRDATIAESIADALGAGGLSGDVSLVMREGAAPDVPARGAKTGRALVDVIECSDDMRHAVEALLGDVVVCANRNEAFKAFRQERAGLRFVSADGCAIWPSGKVRVYGKPAAEVEGVMARERRLADLQRQAKKARKDSERANAAAEAADEAYRTMQVETLKLSQQLANSQGALDAAQTDVQRTERRVSAVGRDLEAVVRQAESANESLEGLQPGVDAAKQAIAEIEERRANAIATRDAHADEVAPLRQAASDVADKLSEAKLAAATLSERKTYNERLVVARERDIESIDRSSQRRKHDIARKGVVVKRADELLALIDQIANSLQRRVMKLDAAVNASNDTATSVHATAAAAREAARRAHDEYDAASQRMSQVQVDKSRLEVRVETAVATITADLGVPLDHAQTLPPLENRREAEDETFRLERRIKNMGTINPDAADEYAALKERYDFLAGQLADMEAARASLNRIVRVIDARMKDDFINTYEQVNRNFNEIFSLLFPGGSAHLSLEDPDDIDNTGVEVTAQPRGKRLTKMMLMSGGEKSLTALALLFAVYKTRSTPFYILDEVEAALDDTNLRRLMAYIDSLRATTQLIMITHQRRTMEMADVLFGVSMQSDGVTKVISQKLERALEQAEA